MGYLRTSSSNWPTGIQPQWVSDHLCWSRGQRPSTHEPAARCHYPKKGLLHVAARVRLVQGVILNVLCAGERFLLRAVEERSSMMRNRSFSRKLSS